MYEIKFRSFFCKGINTHLWSGAFMLLTSWHKRQQCKVADTQGKMFHPFLNKKHRNKTKIASKTLSVFLSSSESEARNNSIPDLSFYPCTFLTDGSGVRGGTEFCRAATPRGFWTVHTLCLPLFPLSCACFFSSSSSVLQINPRT